MSVSQFPNRATMWPKGVSANPGGKPKGGRGAAEAARVEAGRGSG